MVLTLDPADLQKEFQTQGKNGVDQKLSTRDIKFEMFTDQAQKAIKAVGRATFYAWDRQTYNAIYPPK